LALSAALALTGLSATACGGESDADDVRTVWLRAQVAVAKGDGHTACALMTKRAQHEVAMSDPLHWDAFDCPGVIALDAPDFTPAQLRAVRDLKVRRVSIDGNRATVRDQDIDFPQIFEDQVPERQPMVFRRGSDGSWKVDEVG